MSQQDPSQNVPGAPGQQGQPTPDPRHGQGGRPAPQYGPDGRPTPQYGQYGQPAPQPGEEAPQDGPVAPQPGPPDPQYGQYGQPAPQYGQYGQPAPQPGQYGQLTPRYGQYGAPAAPGPAPFGFAGPRQPGIIPLRPLNVGEILDGAFRAIRANPKVMFGFSLVVMGVIGVLEAVVLGAFMDQALLVLEDPTVSLAELGALSLGSTVAGFATSLATFLASVVLTGILIVSVSQSVLGRTLPVGEVWGQVKGRVWRLIGLTLLLGLLTVAAVVVVVLVVLAVVGATALGNDGGSVAVAVVVSILAILGGAVLMVFFVVRLGIAAPALVLERTGVLAAVRRSWSLTAGSFWRIFGILALAWIIVTVLTWALMVPVTFVSFLGTGVATSPAYLLGSTVLSVLISALTTPFLAAVEALVYIDVRIRREGLDVELARAAEAG